MRRWTIPGQYNPPKSVFITFNFIFDRGMNPRTHFIHLYRGTRVDDTQWHARTVIYNSNYIYTVVTVIYQVIYQVNINSQSVIYNFVKILSKIKIPTSIVRIRKENNPMLPFAKKASFNKNLTVYQRYVGAYIDSTDTKTYITSGTRALCFLRKQAVSLSLSLRIAFWCEWLYVRETWVGFSSVRFRQCRVFYTWWRSTLAAWPSV